VTKQRIAAAILLLALAQAGCTSRPASAPATPASPTAEPTAPAPAPGPVNQASPPPSKTEPTPPATSPPIDLMQVRASRDLTMEQLVQGLDAYLNARKDSPTKKLGALYAHWGLKENAGQGLKNILFTEADLNGDGTPETVTALNARGRAGTEGAVAVIAWQENAFVLDRTTGGGEPGVGAPREAVLLGVRDVTGDGHPDIIWASPDHGAHTSYAYFFVTQWEPRKVTTLPGTIYMSFPEATFDGQDLLLHGGTIGSAGAGTLQRAYTDRYRYRDGQMTRVDRQYDSSDFSYHRLQDGLVAEQYGRTDDALPAYRGALNTPEGKDMESVPPEWQERFRQAVPAFARFRLGLLLFRTNKPGEAERVLKETTGPYAGLSEALRKAGGPEPGCQAAANWAEANPEFLEALNSPWGYANPKWKANSLCDQALPPAE
jgi:hypothetical protein